MRYTINQLAKFSGVSTRTLRFYDENQYLYYKEEQLLML
ncbi:MAG: MerR family DNA-binding transcriptional regulator [Legionella sp.]|nr:MerR family DNA-binding transcriptional regulator [Legionella sp.]